MIGNWLRVLHEHPRALDLAVALLLLIGSLPGSRLSVLGEPAPDAWWLGVVLTAIGCAALQWRRGRPRVVLVAATACAAGVAALGLMLTVLTLGPLMVALYSLAARTGHREAYTWAFSATALVVVTAVIAEPGSEPAALKTIGPIAWLALPAVLGAGTRLRRRYFEAIRARAEHAERTREEEARHRVAEERMRIARDLHDVVAHHMALANAQANAVARLISGKPEQAREIVTELTGTTATALRELKATVGLMRQGNDPDTSLEPAPGLARLPDLVGSFEAAGLTVTVHTEGRPRPLSPGVDLTAFRIIQEALTNVSKHAASPTAQVRLAYDGDRLGVTVLDEGPGAPPVGAPGYGLIGMRERALSVGGRLHAGPRPTGGFEVSTDLPVHS